MVTRRWGPGCASCPSPPPSPSSAALSPLLTRATRPRFTVCAGLAAVAGGLWQVSLHPAVATTYLDVLPGLLLIGLGAGLLLPTATNSVLGAVPQGDAGVGSATNSVSLQVGGALGVAVIGSLLSTRYQDRMTSALAAYHVPAPATRTILGSLGAALDVAAHVGGATGALLALTARSAFMSGASVAVGAGAAVALGGGLLALVALPSARPTATPGPPER